MLEGGCHSIAQPKRFLGVGRSRKERNGHRRADQKRASTEVQLRHVMNRRNIFFNRGGVVRHELIHAGISDVRRFTLVEKRYSSIAGFLTDQTGGMRFYNHRIFIRSVPRPVDFIGRDSLKVPFLAMKSFVLYEEPDFSLLHVIDLFGYVNMGSGMITWSPRRNHETAFVAVGFL